MKRTYNGLFLSFDDFKNNYTNYLKWWLNKYNNANELLFLQMLKNLYINSGYIDKELYLKEKCYRLIDELEIERVNEETGAIECEKISINRLTLRLNMRISRYIDFFCFDFSDTEIFDLLKKYNSVIYNHFSNTDNLLKEYYPRLTHKGGLRFVPDELLERIISGYINHIVTKSFINRYEGIKYKNVEMFIPFLWRKNKKIFYDKVKHSDFLYSIMQVIVFIDKRSERLKAEVIDTIGLLPHEIETKIINTTTNNTKIEEVTWEGSKSDLLELFKTLKTLGKVEYNADNDTELLPILKATFEGVNSGVTWKGSENEFYELFKALWLCKYIKPFENTDVSLFKFLGGAMGKDIRALGQMKQRNADKKRYLCDELIKEDITKELKELLKTIRAKFYDFVNE